MTTTMVGMLIKINEFRELLETQQQTRMRAQGHPENCIEVHYTATVKVGGKYARVDLGRSGKYMVELDTGNIFGIKGYGVIHRGHAYGTVDTIAEWDWSDYVGHKLPVPF